MAKQALSRLGRKELLELMLEQSKEIDCLRAEVEELKARLAEQQIISSQCGSLAEAALRLNGVFEAAQKSCDRYTEGVQKRCEAMEAETRQRCETMISDTRARCRKYIEYVKNETHKENPHEEE